MSVINEPVRGTLEVDRFGQNVLKQSMLRCYGQVKSRDEDCVCRTVT